jgi:hypothetical protein
MKSKIELNQLSLEKLMQFRPCLIDVACYFSTSVDTIERRIKEWENCTFTEFRERYSFGLKKKLIDKAINLGLSGNPVMLKYCLANICGWSERPATEANNQSEIKITINNEDMKL